MRFRTLIVLFAIALATASAADVYKYRYQVVDSSADPTKPIPAFYYVDTAAELPSANQGDLGYAADTAAFYVRDASTWAQVGGTPSGAPTDATYITQTANGSLSAEQALSALGTGLVKNTTTTGVLSIYAGSNCVNGASLGTRAYGIDASGTALCDYTDVDVVVGVLPVTNGGTGASTATTDAVMVGDGSAWNRKVLPDCPAQDGNTLNYDNSTQAFSCGQVSGSGGWTLDAATGSSTSDATNGTTVAGISIPMTGGVPTNVRCTFITLSASTNSGVQIKPNLSGSPSNLVWTRTSCASSTSTRFWNDSGSSANGTWDAALSAPIEPCTEEINLSAIGGGTLTFSIKPESASTLTTIYNQSFCEYRDIS